MVEIGLINKKVYNLMTYTSLNLLKVYCSGWSNNLKH